MSSEAKGNLVVFIIFVLSRALHPMVIDYSKAWENGALMVKLQRCQQESIEIMQLIEKNKHILKSALFL